MLIASTDISSVPPDFVKWFMIMFFAIVGAAGTGFVAYRKGKQASGTSDEPVNIKQPIEIKKQASYAHKKDLEKLQKKVDGLNHAGEERRVDILKAIHEAERRTVNEVKDLHVRLNPVAEGFKAHEALLGEIGKRLAAAEKNRQDDMSRMQQRIDDAIRTAAQTSNQS